MHYKEAARQLSELGRPRMFDIEVLYKDELYQRAKLRAHGTNIVTKSMMEGLHKEMNDWIIKVCRVLGMSEDACEKARQECTSTALLAMNLAINEYERGK